MEKDLKIYYEFNIYNIIMNLWDILIHKTLLTGGSLVVYFPAQTAREEEWLNWLWLLIPPRSTVPNKSGTIGVRKIPPFTGRYHYSSQKKGLLPYRGNLLIWEYLSGTY